MNKFILYNNGEYVLEHEAKVSFLDRGFQFSDGVYEVISIHLAHPVKLSEHLERINRSFSIIRMVPPFSSNEAYKDIIRNLMSKNNIQEKEIEEGYIYIQVTRGVAPRSRPFPKEAKPTTIISVKPYDFPIRYNPVNDSYEGYVNGVKAITVPDERWKRSDLKSLALLPTVLASQKASENDAFEAIMIKDNGEISEGTVSNVWIVDSNGVLRTHYEGFNILPGIVRKTIKEFAYKQRLNFEEKPFSVQEALNAKEIFLTGTRTKILPVTQLNDNLIADGKPGIITMNFLKTYWEFVYSGIWFDW
ncbi:aminotransferase class IV [Candidatus Tisiphia endosymbiont of Sialis lutaria]|uniref:aminotransferase class IV n=1 Tax=Candidatus Tisiphia endosymbiont of Sialis lutaria TaxID=2029164 RepID=UPI00312CA36B